MNEIDHAMYMLDPGTYTHIDDENIQHLLPKQMDMESYILLIQSIRSMSKDAIDIIELIMNPPQDLCDKLAKKNSTKLTLGKITEYLRQHNPYKWKHKTIKKAFDEIRKMLREC